MQPNKKLSVLIVEDNIHMLRILGTMVRGFGFDEVFLVQDPAEALEIIKANVIDLMFIDYRMPVLDGIEFTQLVRNSDDSPNPYVPIIMVTAHSEPSKVRAARDAGVTEFCCKPINAKTLYSRIISVVNKPRDFIRSSTYFGPDRRRRDDPTYRGPERRKDRMEDIEDDDAVSF
ncbi:MAG: two-component system response regulator [Ponticaulis sp.]|nr:two-component system response regulator [Ponticaulis sp.]|tara:strand:- start:12986 stop:13507 length:522 start_codon:yes stop_codon:yes gene_type:complete